MHIFAKHQDYLRIGKGLAEAVDSVHQNGTLAEHAKLFGTVGSESAASSCCHNDVDNFVFHFYKGSELFMKCGMGSSVKNKKELFHKVPFYGFPIGTISKVKKIVLGL